MRKGRSPGGSSNRARGRISSPMAVGASVHETSIMDPRHYLGLSLGVQELYDGNIFAASEPRESDMITFVMPRVFVNLADRRSQFHFDYGFGYRKYNSQGELDSPEHYGSAQFNHSFSRRTTMSIFDVATYGRNDGGSAMGSGWGIADVPGNPANEVYLENQNTFRNVLTARMDYQLNRKVRLGGYASYTLYRFQENPESDGQSLLAGFSYDHQLNRWLDFSMNLSAYIVRPTGGLENNEDMQISRLQLVGFTTRLSRNWELNVGGALSFPERCSSMTSALATMVRSGGLLKTTCLVWIIRTVTLPESGGPGLFSRILSRRNFSRSLPPG